MLEFEISTDFDREIEISARPAILRDAETALDSARFHCPVGDRAFEDADGNHPGALHESLEIVYDEDTGGWLLGSDVSYAADVEFGTDPHIIPNGWGRGIEIHHPGTGATAFLRNAVYRKHS